MKSSASFSSVMAYLLKHWFKVILFSIVVYAFVQKDFQFSINLNSPQDEESSKIQPNNFGSQVTQKKPILTDKQKQPPASVDKFELPSPFSSTPKYNPMANLGKIDEKVQHDYLKRFARVVINERRKYGIPSSIILACGLLHSQAGQRDMSKKGNNHFALTCSLEWEGETGAYRGACHRHYENAWASYRDHSVYLTSGQFAQLTTLESTNYKDWAKGLNKLNYGGIENLDRHLISIIEKYGLDELDRR